MSYRAAIFCDPTCQAETVLTGPEQSDLSADALYAEAVRIAISVGLIGDEPHQVTQADLIAGLYIATWRESVTDLNPTHP